MLTYLSIYQFVSIHTRLYLYLYVYNKHLELLLLVLGRGSRDRIAQQLAALLDGGLLAGAVENDGLVLGNSDLVEKKTCRVNPKH